MLSHAPTILLHGFTGVPALWNRVLARLPRRFDAQALPLPGHRGGLALRPGASFVEVIDDFAQHLVQRGLHDAHIVGYSLGGRIALGLLVRHRALFRAATLIGVHPGLDTAAERAERAAHDAAWVNRLRQQSLAEVLESWDRQPVVAVATSVPRATLDDLRVEREFHDPEQLALGLEQLGLAAMPSLRQDLPQLTLPVDLLTGELDTKYRALAEEMAAQLPQARLAVIPRAGHNAVLENPQTVARFIEERATS